MTDQPRDEREFKAQFAIQTPSWLPGANASVDYRRLWDRRRHEDLISSTARKASISERELVDRLEHGDQAIECFVAAGENYANNGSEFVRDTFASLLAAALLDEAKVDSISYLMARLRGLEPIHIRIIANLPDTRIPLDIDRIAQACHAHEGIVHDALKKLADLGFVKRVASSEPSQSRTFGRQPGIETESTWETEPVGRAAYIAILEAKRSL